GGFTSPRDSRIIALIAGKDRKSIALSYAFNRDQERQRTAHIQLIGSGSHEQAGGNVCHERVIRNNDMALKSSHYIMSTSLFGR
ncbi:MAG TPA: hypothetical protein VGK56_12220, partial [Anaerolineales bacterium]